MNMLQKIVGGGIAVAAMLAFTTPTAQAQNLLVNGDFENAGGFTANPITVGTVNSGWALFGAAARTDMSSAVAYPQSGSFALIEQNAPGNNWNPAGAYQIVSGVSAGQTYSFGGFYLADTAMTGTFGTPVCFQITFDDAALNNLGTVEAGPGNGVGGFSYSAATLDNWYSGSVMATAPAGTAYAVVYAMFMSNGQTATDSIYFDNMSLVAAPEPTSFVLVGAGLLGLRLLRRRNS
jgi:hypothetical protein